MANIVDISELLNEVQEGVVYKVSENEYIEQFLTWTEIKGHKIISVITVTKDVPLKEIRPGFDVINHSSLYEALKFIFWWSDHVKEMEGGQYVNSNRVTGANKNDTP